MPNHIHGIVVIKNPHQETYDLVRECLNKINEQNREEFVNRLEQRQGKLAKLRYLLFVQPDLLLLVYIFIFYFVRYDIPAFLTKSAIANPRSLTE
jgi:CHASE3 domain sensor protein